MSGLFSAAFLRQIGWDVDVYERSAVELVGRGAGITGHPELLDALEASGAGTKELGIEVPKRVALDRDGRITDERPLRQILTSWDRLQRLLRATIDAAHYHLGWNFERVEQDERGVRVQFADGRVEHADILVGGDGIRSSVRAQLAPEVQPIYAGYYIWRGAPNEADLAPETLRRIYPLFTFYLPKRQQVITYPISGFDNDLRPGHRRFNFIWYRVADAAQMRDMCVDENGMQHDYSVPPPLIRKDLIAAMHEDATRDHAAGAARRLAENKTALHHADLRFHRAAHRVRPRRAWSAMRRPTRARIWASAWPRPAPTRRRWRKHCAITTTSTRTGRLQCRPPADRQSYRDARPQARHPPGRRSQDRGGSPMHDLLQSDGAMLDWIAVPHFLDAYQ